MRFFKNKLFLVVVVVLIYIAVFLFFAVHQFLMLQKAHSTFENYYAFRDCVSLLKKTSTYGICKINTGQTIKIVLFKGRWYLDGDVPTCIRNFCL